MIIELLWAQKKLRIICVKSGNKYPNTIQNIKYCFYPLEGLFFDFSKVRPYRGILIIIS